MKIDRTARLFVTVGQDRTWSSPRHVELLKIWQAGDAMVTHLMPWKKSAKAWIQTTHQPKHKGKES